MGFVGGWGGPQRFTLKLKDVSQCCLSLLREHDLLQVWGMPDVPPCARALCRYCCLCRSPACLHPRLGCPPEFADLREALGQVALILVASSLDSPCCLSLRISVLEVQSCSNPTLSPSPLSVWPHTPDCTCCTQNWLLVLHTLGTLTRTVPHSLTYCGLVTSLLRCVSRELAQKESTWGSPLLRMASLGVPQHRPPGN